MTRICSECGHIKTFPLMKEEEYQHLLEEIGGSRGEKNRIVKWIKDIEREEGITEAMFTLEEYMAEGCGIAG